MTDQPLTVTVEQAGKVLGISRSTAYELARTGDIPTLRLGRRIVVPVAKLADALAVTPGEVSAAIGQLRRSAPARSAAVHVPHRGRSATEAMTLF